ncbi:MAG: hypothetical protein M3335_11395 [Actinomycetota bacterium]|nr:hypothetical protein [Actinomycetota bacterium]
MVVIVLALTLVSWVGLVVLFSSLTGSFLAGTTLLMVLAWAANFIVRARIH